MKKILGFVVFMLLWIAACAAQDYLLHLKSDSWLMVYGYAAGLIATIGADVMKG